MNDNDLQIDHAMVFDPDYSLKHLNAGFRIFPDPTVEIVNTIQYPHNDGVCIDQTTILLLSFYMPLRTYF